MALRKGKAAMPLALYFYPSFERSLKKLSPQQRQTVGYILESLEVYFAHNCNLDAARRVSIRFFYKQLRKPYFEAGVERLIRVLLKREGERCIAVLAGDHDEIKQFLRQV